MMARKSGQGALTTSKLAKLGPFAPASLSLPPFGTLGIDPTLALALTPIQIPQPAGVGSISITVPSQSGLIGIPIFAQTLLVPYPFQPRLSNVVRDVIQ